MESIRPPVYQTQGELNQVHYVEKKKPVVVTPKLAPDAV
jgi:hypothetical protein